ncbi:hypothetical protein TWF696_005235 [Orbilia brochopaga]|uniref:Uncharacterized protein n=1 Tax=Orbilia brochopaga TaxID=3140254 RepID=A0AAV9V1S7_9PEZI
MLLAARRPSSSRPLFLSSSSQSRSLVFFVRRVSRQSPDPADPDTAPKHSYQPYSRSHHHLHRCYSHHRHAHPASWLSAWAQFASHAKCQHDHNHHHPPSQHHHHSQPHHPRLHHQHSLKDLYHRIARLRDQHAHQWTSPARQQALDAATALRVSLIARLREMSKPYTRSKPQLHRDGVPRKRSPDPPASPAAAAAADATAAQPPLDADASANASANASSNASSNANVNANANADPPLNATNFSRVENPYEDTEIDYITLKRVPRQGTPSSSDPNFPAEVETSDVQSHMQATETAQTAGAVEPSQDNFTRESQLDTKDVVSADFQMPQEFVSTPEDDLPSRELQDDTSGKVEDEVNTAASTPAIDMIRGQQDFYMDDGLYGKVAERPETPISSPLEPVAATDSSLNETNMNAMTVEEATSAAAADADQAAAVSPPPSSTINVEPIPQEYNTPPATPSGPEEAPDAKFAKLETPIDPPKLSPADLIASLRYYDRRRGTLPDEEPLSAQDIAILEALRKADESTSENARPRSTWSSRAKKAGLVISSVVLGTYVVGVGNKLLSPQPDSSAAAEMLTAVQRSRAAK